MEAYKAIEVLRAAENVDLVITHTAPRKIIEMLLPHNIDPARVHDPTAQMLDACLGVLAKKKFRPAWYFGHFHIDAAISTVGDMSFTCLGETIKEIAEEKIIELGSKRLPHSLS